MTAKIRAGFGTETTELLIKPAKLRAISSNVIALLERESLFDSLGVVEILVTKCDYLFERRAKDAELLNFPKRAS